QGFRIQKTHRLAMEAEKALAAKQTLTDEQKEAQKTWENQRKYFNPTAEDLKKEREMYIGSYFHLLGKRAAMVKEWHSGPFYMSGWDMFTMILVGIAFAKMGLLSASLPMRSYKWMMWTGYAIGLPIGCA